MWAVSATIVTTMTATATQTAASATRTITSTITESVRRSVNAARIAVASQCDGGSTPLKGDAPPKRAPRGPDQAEWGERDDGDQGEERREQSRH